MTKEHIAQCLEEIEQNKLLKESDPTRYNEELERIKGVLIAHMENPALTPESWRAIKDNLPLLNEILNLVHIHRYAPSHQLAADLLDEMEDLGYTFWRKAFIDDRINYLIDHPKPKSDIPSRIDRWKKLKQIVAGDKYLRPMRAEYWREAWHGGNIRVISEDEEHWFQKWSRSKTHLNYSEWRQEIGLEQKFIYLSEDKLSQYCANIKEGLFYNQHEEQDSVFHAKCVMSADETLYYDKRKNVPHHSSFPSGKPVIFAGHLTIEKGKLTEVDNLSGHYKPTETHLLKFLSILKKKYDIPLEGVEVAVCVGEGLLRTMKKDAEACVRTGSILQPLVPVNVKNGLLCNDEGEPISVEKRKFAITQGNVLKFDESGELSRCGFLSDGNIKKNKFHGFLSITNGNLIEVMIPCSPSIWPFKASTSCLKFFQENDITLEGVGVHIYMHSAIIKLDGDAATLLRNDDETLSHRNNGP